MSAGQQMQANLALPESHHGRPHMWTFGCAAHPACQPEPVLERIAREVEVETITATVALLRQHMAGAQAIYRGGEELAFKAGYLSSTLQTVDEALAALVARIGG